MNNFIVACLGIMMISVQACGQKSKDGEKTDVVPVSEYVKDKDYSPYEVATFAGGCFWCTEAAFERINGVIDVISGYSGGQESYPTYYEVGAERTGHAEAIHIWYDPVVVTFNTLLQVFFVAHDPTQLNRQGPDHGPQYRSAVFYHNEGQKTEVEGVIKILNESGQFSKKIVTQVAPFSEFWVAEQYHQNFYELNPDQRYVVAVSKPKVKKVLKTFPHLIKEKYRK